MGLVVASMYPASRIGKLIMGIFTRDACRFTSMAMGYSPIYKLLYCNAGAQTEAQGNVYIFLQTKFKIGS